jgi:hypothetical protein
MLAFCVPKFAGNHHSHQISPRGNQTTDLAQGKKTQNFPNPPKLGHFVAIPH